MKCQLFVGDIFCSSRATSHLTYKREILETGKQQVGAVAALTQVLTCVTHRQQDQ